MYKYNIIVIKVINVKKCNISNLTSDNNHMGDALKKIIKK